MQGCCQFSDPGSVLELTCSKESIVELHFRSCGGRSLFAHPAFLSAWSGVLRNVLEDVVGFEGVGTPGRAQEPAPADGHITIPLDDSDTAAWEDALALMHPSRQLFKMGWDSAARLLLLAHKYDMPAITARVEEFLMGPVLQSGDSSSSDRRASTTSTSSSGGDSSSCFSSKSSGSITSSSSSSGQPCMSNRLAEHLTADNAPGWLQLTSMCGLDPQADMCIDVMVQQQVPVDLSLLNSIQPKHADALLASLLQQLRVVSDTAARQEQTLATAALPITGRTPSRRARCPDCKMPWFKLPDGRSTPHCCNCGKRRPIILGELYQHT